MFGGLFKKKDNKTISTIQETIPNKVNTLFFINILTFNHYINTTILK